MCKCTQQLEYNYFTDVYEPAGLNGWLSDNWKKILSPTHLTASLITKPLTDSNAARDEQLAVQTANINYLAEQNALLQQQQQAQNMVLQNEVVNPPSVVPGISNQKLMIVGGGVIGGAILLKLLLS